MGACRGGVSLKRSHVWIWPLIVWPGWVRLWMGWNDWQATVAGGQVLPLDLSASVSTEPRPQLREQQMFDSSSGEREFWQCPHSIGLRGSRRLRR